MTFRLRRAVTGLLSFACAEEQALILICVSGACSDGVLRGEGPDRWVAVPLAAHNNEFKNQQAERPGRWPRPSRPTRT